MTINNNIIQSLNRVVFDVNGANRILVYGFNQIDQLIKILNAICKYFALCVFTGGNKSFSIKRHLLFNF